MDYRDYISRQAVLDLMIHIWGENFSGDSAMQESIDAIRVLPSVTPQEPIHGKCNQCKGSFTDSDIASIVYNSPTIIEADTASEG